MCACMLTMVWLLERFVSRFREAAVRSSVRRAPTARMPGAPHAAAVHGPQHARHGARAAMAAPTDRHPRRWPRWPWRAPPGLQTAQSSGAVFRISCRCTRVFSVKYGSI